jgi:tetratricopeptide (TPR) repeat protein
MAGARAPRIEGVTRMATRIGWRQALGVLALLGCGAVAHADGGGGGGGGGGAGGAGDAADPAAQPDYVKGLQAIEYIQWNDAIVSLRRHVLANDGHADGHNWLAYAYRQAGRMEEAFRHYRRALGIDPQHLGAHEYLGEAYLKVGRPRDAERHLQRLAELCGTNCEQYRDLEGALAAYRAQTAAKP